jgi:peptidoglycan/xylan/chitin deacetylase (PgdA/CDA1 family)
MSLIRSAKRSVLAVSKSAGAFSLIANSRWRASRLLILCYHGISKDDEDQWSPGLYMKPATFRGRMEMLRKGGYTVLDLGEGLRLLSSGELPPRSVVITFDDGDHDFYQLAWPILREFGFPSTVYLTTYYCLNQLPVFDVVCSYVLWKGRGRTFVADGLIGGNTGRIELAGDTGWRAIARLFHKQVRDDRLSALEKDALAEELASRLQVDYSRIRDQRLLYLMSPAEVREVSQNGVAVELHTHRHRTPRDRALFDREIVDNRDEIIRITQREPKHFCYPSGDYAPEFYGWLRAAGVRSATICVPGLAAHATNPYELPRLLDVETLSGIEFEGWLTGFSSFMPGRRY